MKRFLILLTAVCCTLPMAAQWGRRPTPNDTLQSTRVLPDGKVLFQIYAPEAKTVSVSGDLPWDKQVRFEKAGNGVWKGVCEGLDRGVFRYNFTVDGVRVQDPKAPLSAEQSSLLTVGESYIKDVPHGAVAQRFYYSKPLGTMRRMHVWTPAGYEKTKAKLPVLYLIHGGGDNDASWPGVGAAGWILDNLLAQGKMVPMIVVMPNGTIDTPDMMGEVPVFGEDMVTSIIPFIEANYRVKADRKHRAMAGLSMGGMETMETAFLHPELFSYVWVLSSSFSPGNQKPYIERIKLHEIAPALNKNFKALVFTQGGPTDIAYNNCKETLGYLDAAGIKYDYMENAQAGHSWTTWRADLETLAPTLFR
ncbi:MAG: endo-1,4-beta-xylanase Z [Bacteroidales bacterium]|nr:endo-1,4-beta-xylanase Z [Bacteroidales bacterium]